MLINEAELRKQVEKRGLTETVDHLVEALKKGDVKPDDISIKGIAENTITDLDGKVCGREFLRELEKKQLTENMANAVSLANFSNIIQQQFFNSVLQGYNLMDSGVADLVPVVSSNVIATAGETVPGITNLGDASKILGPGEEYPMASVEEQYIQTPRQNKMGFIVPIEREALIADRTGLLVERCRDLGRQIRIDRENEICDVIINANGSTARAPKTNGSCPYNYRGSNYALWQTSSSAPTNYLNQIVQKLVDASSVEAMWLALQNILDPDTGAVLDEADNNTLLVTQDNYFPALRILHGLQYRTVSGEAATANMAPMLVSDGRTVTPFNIVKSKILGARLDAASQDRKTVFFGDFARVFRWMQSLPIMVEEALPNSGKAFTHDVVMQFKAFRYETAAIFNPRYIVKATPS